MNSLRQAQPSQAGHRPRSLRAACHESFTASALAAFAARSEGLTGRAQLLWQRHEQRLRAQLDATLKPVAALAARPDAALPPSTEVAGTAARPAATAAAVSPVAALLAQLQPSLSSSSSSSADALSSNGAPFPPLKAEQLFASRWATLRVEARLAAALAELPSAPGPLNSHHLLAQSLRSLQQISPAYLDRLLAWGEELASLEQGLEALLTTAPEKANKAPKSGKSRRR